MQHQKLFRPKDLIDAIEQLDSSFTIDQVEKVLKAQHYWTLGNTIEVNLNHLVESGILTERNGTYSLFQNFRKSTWSEISDGVTERLSLWEKLASL